MCCNKRLRRTRSWSSKVDARLPLIPLKICRSPAATDNIDAATRMPGFVVSALAAYRHRD